MHKNLKTVLFSLSMLSLSHAALATTNFSELMKPYSYVVTVSGGPSWENTGNTQTLTLAPETDKTYTTSNATNTLMNGELFLGLQRAISERFQGQLGVAFAGSSSATVSGDIWDDADPAFDNYTYNYQINHSHIAVKGKLIANMGWVVMPWLAASVGVGFNETHSFNNTPTIEEAVASPDFSNNRTTAFTYTVEAGLERALSQHLQIGASYLFSDWGKSQLGTAPGQTTGNVLTQSHLYNNGFLLNLTYIA